MTKILVAAHGETARSLVQAADLITGDNKDLDYFCLTKNMSGEELEYTIKKYLDKEKNQQLIVLTDIFGGSVANAFMKFLIEGYQFDLITGVNLPLLLSLLLSPEKEINKKIDQGILEGKAGIIYVNERIKNKKEDKDD